LSRVAITRASGQVGTLLGAKLAAAGVELTPLGRADDWAAGIAGADAVAALAGTLKPGHGDNFHAVNVETAARTAEAARAGGVGRIAFLQLRRRRAIIASGPRKSSCRAAAAGGSPHDVAAAPVGTLTNPDAPTGVFAGRHEEISMDDFVRAVNGGTARIRHGPPPSPASPPASLPR
jgi:hypothetical protein